MRTIDLSSNGRLPILLETVRRLSRARNEGVLTGELVDNLRRAYGGRGFLAVATRGLGPGRFRVTRALDADGRERVPLAAQWFTALDRPVREGGLVAALIEGDRPKLVRDLAVADDPVLGDYFAPYCTVAAGPVFLEGEVAGWLILSDDEPERLGERDVEEMVLRANLVGLLAENMRLARELREASARIRAEVEQIAAIQRQLLPSELPDLPGLALAASFETFDRAGGDFYDFVPLDDAHPDGPWALLIADASGHGPAAAVVAAILQSVLRTYPGRPDGPGALLAYLNRHLYAKRLELTFVTAFLAVYDPATRALRYARAGHNPPLVKTPAGEVFRLDAVGSPPLGVLADTVYGEAVRTLAPGDLLLLYTDGITETRDREGRFFGEEGIERAMEVCREDTADCVIGHIRDAIRAYEGGRRPSDDQTLIALRVR